MSEIRIGDVNTLRVLKEALNKEMLAEAEPVIQEALKQVEAAMRRRLAATLIARIDSSVSMHRMGQDLCITIERSKD